jgi:hypothetical protein
MARNALAVFSTSSVTMPILMMRELPMWSAIGGSFLPGEAA